MEDIKKLFVFVLLFTSCVTQPIQQLNPKVYYKRDMPIRVNGQKGTGTLVVSKDDFYDIKAWFKGDYVILKTCHREIEMEDLGDSEKFEFEPVNGLEDTGKCYLEIASFEHKKGRHSWALIDFESDLFKLKAFLKCNGKLMNADGVGICQSKEGLLQTITFEEKAEPASACAELMKTTDQITYEYLQPNREQVCLFKGESGKLFKITLIGYEKLLIRKL